MDSSTESVANIMDSRAIDEPGDTIQRLHLLFELQATIYANATAVESECKMLTYRELDEWANALARRLKEHGVTPGDRIGVMVPRSPFTYQALLAVLKVGAVLVPIDASAPADRVVFMAQDAELTLLLTCANTSAIACTTGCPILLLDDDSSTITESRDGAITITEPSLSSSRERNGTDVPCYIIYTSGSTGRPKGVVISHASICNYVTLAVPDVYRVTAQDRVYQGITFAFDFSLEEIWITWMAGATLVCGPTDDRRIGPGLTEFLVTRRVTVLGGVPTLLATLEGDLPSVRLIITGGEVCSSELIARWARPGRRILNTYGPTETTITATWTELEHGRPVTIGRPLPTYTAYILDDNGDPAKPGAVGEIWIGGPGVAIGYLGAPELTAQRFVPDPYGARPGDRRYCTGDLGRWTADGEIEFHGRVDGQVKLRGFRIDLGEIESVLMEESAVCIAIVRVFTSPANGDELAAAITLATGMDPDDPLLRQHLIERLRRRLPAYMVPSFLDIVQVIPTLPSGKADRKALPAPVKRLEGEEPPYAAPESAGEKRLALLWSQVLGQPQISIDADFFMDLGGHSLSAARVISAMRTWEGHSGISITDLYLYRRVRTLAAHTETLEKPSLPPLGDLRSSEADISVSRSSSVRIFITGTVQIACLAVVTMLFSSPFAVIVSANHGHPTIPMIWQISLIFLADYVVATIFLPIVAVRLLMAGVKPGRYRLWGIVYFRWWLARQFLGASLMPLFSGSPLLPVYLCLLGAKVGKGCYLNGMVIEMPHLVRIGDRVSVGADAFIQSHTVEAGWLTLASIEIGNDVYLGTGSVVLGGARLGHGAGLGDQSLAHADQQIPDGEWWSGSPSRRQSEVSAAALLACAAPSPPQNHRLLHLFVYAVLILALDMLVPSFLVPPTALVVWITVVYGVWFGAASLLLAAPVYVVLVCAIVAIGVRIASRGITAGIFPLRSGIGIRAWLIHKLMYMSLLLTQSLYSTLYAPPWLRALGAKVGSNAEIATVSHIDPVLLTFKEGSFLADSAIIGASTVIDGHLVLGNTEVGLRSFVGNSSLVPAGAHVANGSLIGVHTLAPNVIPEGTNWLGSPAIYLPRRQDSGSFPETLTYRPKRSLVITRYMIEYTRITLPVLIVGVSMFASVIGMFGLARQGFGKWALIGFTPALALGAGVLVLFLSAAVKWLLIGRYRPHAYPLWSLFVRRAELATAVYEGAAVPSLLNLLRGTPFMRYALCLFGARIGPRAWIDTTLFTEFDLLRIGADATIGTRAILQTHLFEDRIMKMSYVEVGSGATVGSRSVVLYDSHLGEETVLDSLSLAMKGETFPSHTRWRGIPAIGAGNVRMSSPEEEKY
ncbi:hypothetical protein BGZ75_006957 [Mortierella antarctica]|nr:hypothetical protein BGZ75_006957 [Mortierella antarctica]